MKSSNYVYPDEPEVNMGDPTSPASQLRPAMLLLLEGIN